MTKTAQTDRIEAAQAEARQVVLTSHCPRCSSGLRRNSALAGWWQCEQFGAPTFRARPDEPDCSFQCFTQ